MKNYLLALFIVISVYESLAQELKKGKVLDDKVRTAHIFYVLKDNPKIKQGEYIFKYRNHIQIKGQFENNVQSGEWVYTPDKELKIVGNFVNGKKQGDWNYYLNDKLISVLKFENGILEGRSVGYYENGQLACEVNYNNDKRNGTMTVYYQDGNVKEIENYNQGVVNGIYKKFGPAGDVLLEIEFRNGLPFNLTVNSDKELYEGNLKDGNGEYRQYLIQNEKRQLFMVSNFENGKLHGQMQCYDVNGELKMRGQFSDGYMIGMWEFDINNKDKKHTKAFNLADNVKNVSELNRYLQFRNISIDKNAEFNGGSIDKFREHIILALQYPKKAFEKGIEGKVITAFKVGKTGLLYDFEILQPSEELLNREARRVINTSPLWRPAFLNQMPVDVSFAFPVVFII